MCDQCMWSQAEQRTEKYFFKQCYCYIIQVNGERYLEKVSLKVLTFSLDSLNVSKKEFQSASTMKNVSVYAVASPPLFSLYSARINITSQLRGKYKNNDLITSHNHTRCVTCTTLAGLLWDGTERRWLHVHKPATLADPEPRGTAGHIHRQNEFPGESEV